MNKGVKRISLQNFKGAKFCKKHTKKGNKK